MAKTLKGVQSSIGDRSTGLVAESIVHGKSKNIFADVSDRIQELEELVRKYEEHEGCTFLQHSRFRN